ncbi:16S rRNA (guanine(966)-N(2))-methyltransferase RsmD [Bdellovibrio bacteriovorus]|uniref:16S rRNA (Guanine(966)-N(2))-methyltransferase RsmD n=1 Tax=Bdellovibrio bacteriovorus TaxID=959 RepID=A0A150WIS6_BDEBC|nr:16S rRNA (guanine(966)-N(2))-methyltransferase RsmD [Bdellovibrio bacteriovorus]KYG63335.1 16S rRNA (guanine(966)-N(2))-methyltransferase RsmD [Bdellovibrio bacteriovorus]KYG69449.1 16S rRNA (guanine(966)-N(2))-methyltransferase RsmD [Bdellovibrio bacteriovorus]
MRIISGKYRGHQLVAFKADHIRPTTDRVKETLFNKIQFQIDGANVADLFCGTGNLGIEALSRDAKFCTFVEKNPKSLTITRQNLEKLKVPNSEYKIINMDVIAFLKSYQGEAFDIILADPPFTEKMAHSVMEAASVSAGFAEHTIMAIESEKKERMEERYGSLVRYDQKDYGDKYLNMFCHEAALKEENNE